MKNFLSHPCTSFRAPPFSWPRSQCYLFSRPTFLATLLITGCFHGIAFAQDDNSDRNWDLGLAVGYGERSNPLVTGEDIDINTVIDFSWTGNNFYFDNGDFGYYFLERKSYAFNLVATVNNERNYYNYLTGRQLGLESVVGANFNKTLMPAPPESEEKPKDQNMFVSQEDQAAIPGLPETVSPSFLNQNTDLPDRDFAVNSGIEFLYISPWGDIQAQLLSDVSSTHNGQEAWLSWSHPWYTANSELNLTFGLEWKSADLVSYYYGVRADETFRGRDVYTASAGTNRFIRLAARHSLSRHWNLVAMIEREFLSSAIYESPIVSSHEVDTFFTGLFYQF
ncbi:MAG: MipA/OmpV family protein [Pseudomonadota bacterium]